MTLGRRLAGRAKSLLATRGDGLPGNGADPLDRVEALVKTKPGEGSLFRREIELHQADTLLGEVVTDPEAPERALVLHAQVAMAQKSWDSAVARWARLVERVPEQASFALLQQAAAHREAGDLVAARSAFERVDPEQVGKTAYRRELEKLTDREGFWLSTHLADRALRALDHEDPREPAVFFSAACLTRGLSADVVDRLQPLFGDLRHHALRAVGGRVVASTPPPPLTGVGIDDRDAAGVGHGPLVAVPSGLGWSGSGALTDYLQGIDEAVLPFGKIELTCFRAPYGVQAVFDGLADGAEAYRRGVTTFLLGSVLGIGYTSSPSTLEQRKVRGGSLLEFFRADEERLDEFVALSRRLLAGLQGVDPGDPAAQEHVEAVLREFFGRMIALAAPEGRVCVVNNCVNGLTLHLLHLLPRARAYVMFRDPRDQFVAQLHEGRRMSRMDVDAFVKKVRRYFDSYEQAIADPRVGPSVRRVQFEEFVLRPDVREVILEELGLPLLRGGGGAGSFDPEESRANIGIHREHGSKEDIDAIAATFGDYLIDPDPLPASGSVPR